MPRATLRATLIGLLLALALGGCARVRPWQREQLASRAMRVGFGEQGYAGEYRGRLLESTAGGGAPGNAPGGGCGCTQ